MAISVRFTQQKGWLIDKAGSHTPGELEVRSPQGRIIVKTPTNYGQFKTIERLIHNENYERAVQLLEKASAQ